MSTNEELADLVKDLCEQIEGLQLRIAKLELVTKDVPADHVAAIAAAAAAYLGEKGVRRQPRYAAAGSWVTNARSVQHVHHPLYTR